MYQELSFFLPRQMRRGVETAAELEGTSAHSGPLDAATSAKARRPSASACATSARWPAHARDTLCIGAAAVAAMDKSLVTKATSPDEIPTPGYMFNEIARITHASADACKVHAMCTESTRASAARAFAS